MQGLRDILFRILVSSLVVVFPRQMLARKNVIAAVLLSVQALYLGYTCAVERPPTAVPASTVMKAALRHEYSSQRNVVVMVCNSFRSDVFQKIIQNDEKASYFRGFRLFANTTSGYPSAYASLPLATCMRSIAQRWLLREVLLTEPFTRGRGVQRR